MDERSRTSTSKFLSFVLRHEPQAIGISLDQQGWVEIAALLTACHAHGKDISRPTLDEIVKTSPKQRFAISEDGLRIRANQGHSVDVELGYEPATPPEILFHGTNSTCIESIRLHGLQRMERHHVHLSPDFVTASAVGGRQGRPVVLRILAGRMHDDGCAFFLSANRVWLTDVVPPRYIEF